MAFLQGLMRLRPAVVAAVSFIGICSTSSKAEPYIEYTIPHFKNAGMVGGLLNSCGDSGKAAAYATLVGDLARRNAPAHAAALRQAFLDGMGQGLAKAGAVPADLCQEARELADNLLGEASAAPAASPAATPKAAVASAKTQGPFLLVLRGRAGDAYKAEVTVHFVLKHIAQAAPSAVDTIETELGVTAETRVQELRPNGNIVVVTKPLRLAKYRAFNGTPVYVFNSENPAHRSAAQDDAEGRQMLAALNMGARIEHDGRGALIDYQVDASAEAVKNKADTVLSDAVSQDYVIFPSKPLAIGEPWEIGARDFRFPGVGSLRYTMTGKITATGMSRGEHVAWIEIAGAKPVFSGISQGADTLDLKSFSMKGQVFFALDKGRVVYQSIDLKMDGAVREADGRVNGLDVVGKVTYDEKNPSLPQQELDERTIKPD